jgi:hypothetical protein
VRTPNNGKSKKVPASLARSDTPALLVGGNFVLAISTHPNLIALFVNVFEEVFHNGIGLNDLQIGVAV